MPSQPGDYLDKLLTPKPKCYQAPLSTSRTGAITVS